MYRILTLVLFGLLFSTDLSSQITAVIGTGTSIPTYTLYSPFYRFSNSSTTDYCRSNIVYTQAELSAAGIFPGVTIQKLAFFKNGAGASTGNASFAIWMNNSSTVPPLSSATTWASITSSFTQVYNTSTQTVPAATGWMDFVLTTPFIYTGGSIEIACDWDCSAIAGNPATDKYDWVYTPGFTSSCIGQVNTTTAPAVLNGTTAQYLERPNIRFTFSSGVARDGALASFVSPVSICPSATPIAVKFANYGSDTIKTANVSWKINGAAQTPYSYTGALAQGANANLTLGSYTFMANTSYNIEAYLTDINGLGPDSTKSNDTIRLLNFTTGLSGTYTIDKTLPSSISNYTSFTAFANDLNLKGVCGPVIANVANGPYTEQVSFGQVNGVSGVNTITLNGNGQELNFAPTLSDRHIIKLNGTDYMTINNLKVTGTDPNYGWGIFLTNSADYVTIQNCTVDLSAITSTNSLYSVGIVSSNSNTTILSVGNNANVCTIIGNSVLGSATGGSYYGIVVNGNGAQPGAINCEVRNNIVKDFYYYGIYINSTLSIVVDGNDVSRPNRTSGGVMYGIYMNNGNPGSRITKNHVHNSNGGNLTYTGSIYPIYTAVGGDYLQNMLIANNVIYDISHNGAIYGIYISSAKNIDIYHNSMALDYASGTGTGVARGLYTTGTCDSIRIKNNNFSITKGGTGVMTGIYIATVPATFESNHNNIYVNTTAGTNVFGYYTANRNTLADWQTASLQDANSFSVLPIFSSASTGDLTPAAAPLNNSGENLTVDVPTDVNGVVRPSTPDIGAFEFTPLTDDAGATQITVANCSGTQTAYVKVRNYGLVTLDSVVVSAYLNGSPTSATGNTFYVSVPSGADTTLDLGTFNLLPNTSYTALAFTNLPNGSLDGNRSNDSISISFGLGLNGTYTVNSALPTAGTNFQTFTDLANKLNTDGICGPVVVNTVIGSGPYNEQVLLDEISGTSSVNTLTINGNGETLTFLSTLTSQRAGFSLNETDYTTINNFKIIAQGTTTSEYGFGVHLIGQADNNTISNNTITVDSLSTSSNYAGIAISGSNSSATTSGVNGSYNTIIGNTVVGGYYGISCYGQTSTIHRPGNVIKNNTIVGFYYYGLTSYYQDSVVIEGNSIEQRYNSTTCYALYPYYSDFITVTKNKVIARGTGSNYGIYVYYCDADAAKPSLVANNFVSCLNSTGTVYGISPYNCYYLNVYHNTVNVESGSATASRAMYVYASSTAYNNVEIMNNIIVQNGLGYGVEFTSGATTQNYVTRMDNNNIYAPNGTLGRYNTTNNLTLADWTTVSQKDSNSFSVIPLFNSPTDLHIVSNVLNNKGAVGLGITDDIDGDVRCPLVGCAGSTLKPDIGADEFLGAPITVDLGVDELASPTQKSCYTSTETVTVKIHNYNNTTHYFSLDPASVSVSVTGINPTTFPNVVINTDSLQADSTMLVTLPGTYDMSALGMYDFKVFISQVDDVIHFNDTLFSSVEFSIGTLKETKKQICLGASYDLVLNSASGSIQWQSYNPTTMTWANETGLHNDSVVYPVSPMVTTLYRALGCGTYSTATDTIEVFTTPLPVVTGDSICGAGVANLSATVANGALTWYGNMTGGTALATGLTYSPTVSATDTFYVENLAGSGGSENVGPTNPGSSSFITQTAGWGVRFTIAEDVSINSVVVYPTGSGTMYVEVYDQTTGSLVATSATFNVSGNGSASMPNVLPVAFQLVPGSYRMEMRSTGITNLLRLSGSATFPYTSTSGAVSITAGSTSATATTTSSYYWFFDWNISTGCKSARVPVIAHVSPAPIVNLGNDTTVCIGNSVTLDAGNTGSSFAWSDASTMQTLSVNTTNTYKVTVTNTGGCSTTDSILVTVSPNPVVNLGNDTAVCAGASVTLDAGNAGATYLWNDATMMQTTTATMSNSYSVVVTDANGCKGTDTLVLTVNANPVVNLGNDTAVCAGASVTLDAGNAGATYLWNDATMMQTTTATMSNSYSVVVTDANGCKGTDTLVLTVNANPLVNLGNDTAVCAGASVTLNAGNTGSTYAWSNTATTQTISATTANSYSVVVSNAAGCKGSDTVVVSINSLPVVTLTLSKDTVCQNSGVVTLTGTPAGGVFSGTNVTGSSFNPSAVGSQTLSYAVTDVNGCSASATKAVVVKVCIGIEKLTSFEAKAYPIPTNAMVYVELPALDKNTQITVYAIDGKIVSNEAIDVSSATTHKINLSEVASGVYTLRVTSADKVFTTRLIRE